MIYGLTPLRDMSTRNRILADAGLFFVQTKMQESADEFKMRMMSAQRARAMRLTGRHFELRSTQHLVTKS